jgi:hypothetical protein
MMKRVSYTLLAGLFVLPLLGVNGSARAQETPPSATFSCETTSVVIGIGFSWGKCKMEYQGHECLFKMNGMSLVGLGISKAALTGKVYNMKNLVDFAGGYKAGGVGLTVIAGAGAAKLKNDSGVEIDVATQTVGAKFEIGGGGVTVSLDPSCFQG